MPDFERSPNCDPELLPELGPWPSPASGRRTRSGRIRARSPRANPRPELSHLPLLLTLTGGDWFPFSGSATGCSGAFLGRLPDHPRDAGLDFGPVRAGLRADRRPPEAGGEDDFDWIFLVPALNEEVTIRDSVERLEEIPLERKRIVVINDGSDDGTAEVLATLSQPAPLRDRASAPGCQAGQGRRSELRLRRGQPVVAGTRPGEDHHLHRRRRRPDRPSESAASSPVTSRIRRSVESSLWSASTTAIGC